MKLCTRMFLHGNVDILSQLRKSELGDSTSLSAGQPSSAKGHKRTGSYGSTSQGSMSAGLRASSFSSLKNGLPHAAAAAANGGGASGDRGSNENLMPTQPSAADAALSMTQIVYLLVDSYKLNEKVQHGSYLFSLLH